MTAKKHKAHYPYEISVKRQDISWEKCEAHLAKTKADYRADLVVEEQFILGFRSQRAMEISLIGLALYGVIGKQL